MTLCREIRCEHCDGALTRAAGKRVKLEVRSRVLAFGADGRGEMTCPHCGKSTGLPVRITLHAEKPKQPEPTKARIVVGTGVVRRVAAPVPR